MHPTRVLLVDDIVIFVETLALRLATLPDLLVVGSCTTDAIGVRVDVASLGPDVVVVDLEPMGAVAGDLVATVRSGQPSAHVVVLTGSRDEQLAVTAARAGVDAWVEKASSVDHLVEVLRGVVDGMSWWPPKLLGPVLSDLRGDQPPDAQPSAAALVTLLPLERDVLLMFASRASQAAIAHALAITPREVRSLTQSVLGKLDVASPPEAVRLAIQVALLTASEGAGPHPYDPSLHMHRDDLPPPGLT